MKILRHIPSFIALVLLTACDVGQNQGNKSTSNSQGTLSENYQLPSDITLDTVAERAQDGKIFLSGSQPSRNSRFARHEYDRAGRPISLAGVSHERLPLPCWAAQSPFLRLFQWRVAKQGCTQTCGRWRKEAQRQNFQKRGPRCYRQRPNRRLCRNCSVPADASGNTGHQYCEKGDLDCAGSWALFDDRRGRNKMVHGAEYWGYPRKGMEC